MLSHKKLYRDFIDNEEILCKEENANIEYLWATLFLRWTLKEEGVFGSYDISNKANKDSFKSIFINCFNSLRSLIQFYLSERIYDTITINHRRQGFKNFNFLNKEHHKILEIDIIGKSSKSDTLNCSIIYYCALFFSRFFKGKMKWKLYKLICLFFFKKLNLFKNINVVFTYTYYDWFNIVVRILCNEKKIIFNEVQHGMIFPHVCYHPFTCYKKYFPDTFYVYSKDWVSNSQKFFFNIKFLNIKSFSKIDLIKKSKKWLVIGGRRNDIVEWLLEKGDIKKYAYRPHPAESENLWFNLSESGFEIDQNELDFSLSYYKGVIGVLSTILIEAKMNDIEARILKLPGYEFGLDLNLDYEK
jgi:hypothetical protein